MKNNIDLSIKEIHSLLVKKEITPTDLVNECFDRIEKNDYNAFITLDKEGALKRVSELEQENVDENNLLWGIPVAIKDNIMVKDLRCTCASKMLENFTSIYDASVIEEIKNNKMIIIGKTNMDEFAMGSTSETSYFGAPRNPIDETKVTGGSSGGSAAAVSGKLVPLALGSDTGGSIRQPSAFTGIVGMKPTYGRISRYGLVAFASSLDQIGPMTRTVEDNAILLNSLCKKDIKDLTSFETNEDFTRLIGKDIKGMRIAVPNYFMSDIVDESVKEKINEVIKMLEDNGATVTYVDINHIDKAVTLYQVIAMGEASSNLARFDGIRYGYRYETNNLEEMYTKTREIGFGKEVKRRLPLRCWIS